MIYIERLFGSNQFIDILDTTELKKMLNFKCRSSEDEDISL